MLKRRVIPTLLMRGGTLVKGRGFVADRVVGHPLQAVRIFERRMVDEMILLDIGATPEGRGPDIAAISDVAEVCFMPLTVGGGVRTVDDIRALLLAGADKVALCTAALQRPSLISEASEKFGSQSVVVAIDVRNGRVTSNCGKVEIGCDPMTWAQQAEALGAGEILLSSVERDGTMQGYDLELIRAVAHAVRIPVIASGGAGCPADFEAAFAAGADAVAAGAVWQFSDLTPLMAKRHLAGCGIPVRL